MVLSASSSRSPTEWLTRIEGLLRLGSRKVLILLRGARPEHLGPLVLCLRRQGPARVLVDAASLKTLPHDANVVLLLSPGNLQPLNLLRGVFRRLRLRVVLLASDALASDFGARAPDLFDWISHHIEAPPLAPSYLVSTFRLLGTRTGISFADPSAQRVAYEVAGDGDVRCLGDTIDFEGLVEQLDRPGWIITPKTIDPVDLRLAMALVGRTGQVVAQRLVPGWPRVRPPWPSLDDLEEVPGGPLGDAGELAAMLDFEPDALKLVAEAGSEGWSEDLSHTLDPAAELASKLIGQDEERATQAALGRGPSPLLRVHSDDDRRRAAWANEVSVRLQKGHEVSAEDFATWSRLAPPSVSLDQIRGRKHDLLGAEPWLRARANARLIAGISELARSRGRLELAVGLGVRAREAAPDDWVASSAAARAQASIGRFAEAAEAFQNALTARGSAQPSLGESIELVAELAGVRVEQGHFEEAARILEDALLNVGEVEEKCKAALHDAFAHLEHERGHYRAAETHARAALAFAAIAGGTSSPQYAFHLANLSRVAVKLGQHAEGLELLEQALEIASATLDPDHPSLAALRHNMARSLLDAGRPKDAERELESVLEIEARIFPSNAVAVARTQLSLAEVLMAQNRLDEAKKLAKRAERVARNALGDEHPFVARTRIVHAQVDSALPRQVLREEDAQGILHRVQSAVAARADRVGPNHPHRAQDLRQLGWVLARLGRGKEALEALDAAEAIWRHLPEKPAPEWARLLIDRAELEETLNLPSAAATAASALLAARKAFGESHPLVAYARKSPGVNEDGTDSPA